MTKKNEPAWLYSAENEEIDRELEILAKGKPGEEFNNAAASVARRLTACAVAAHEHLVATGFHAKNHQGLLKLGIGEAVSGQTLVTVHRSVGRPSKQERDDAICDRGDALHLEGLTMTEAAKLIQKELAALADAQVLSWKTIRNILTKGKVKG